MNAQPPPSVDASARPARGFEAAERRRPPGAAPNPDGKFAYIDCLRGYAVLMVVLCHTTYAFPELPYPLHRLTAFGWHGVQLFFLASSLTLLMSAEHERHRTGAVDVRNFFVRRFLRIAPMYYLAAGFYALIQPPTDPSLPQLLASLAFVNAWSPVTMPTTTAWAVVPGGWSIGVEFTFYFLFPVFMALATSARRALVLLAAAVALGAGLNSLLLPRLEASYGHAPADNFLYFWFFNQAPIFVMGALAFFAVRAVQRSGHPAVQAIRRRPGALIVAALALELLVAEAPFGFAHQLRLGAAPPQYLAAAAGFMVFIVGMSQARPGLFMNPVIAHVGKVSFSAYLLHWAVIRYLPDAHPALFHLQAQGWTAIAFFFPCFAVVAFVTCAASTVTYVLVEAPCMRLAKRLTIRRRPATATPQAIAF
jgi:peptidoglycan/LPS O-acetylase OafA/YrhL